MNLEKKIIILATLFVVLIGLLFFNINKENEVERSKESYLTLSKDIDLIKQLNDKFYEKTRAQRRINNYLKNYEKYVVLKKSNKNNVEFKFSKLDTNTLNKAFRELVNAKFKISSLQVEKIGDNSGELSAKVVF